MHCGDASTARCPRLSELASGAMLRAAPPLLFAAQVLAAVANTMAALNAIIEASGGDIDKIQKVGGDQEDRQGCVIEAA